MLQRRLTVVLAASLGAALAVACGSASEHPPAAERSSTSPDATLAADSARPVIGEDAAARDAAGLCFEVDAGPPPPGCSCRYPYGSFTIIDIPCGFTVCSDGNKQAAICSAQGELTVVPNADIAHCPLASDASALPPCDAGTTPDAAR